MLEFRVLGPLQVVKDACSRSAGQSSVGYSLYCCSTETTPSIRDRWVDLLWGESPPTSATNSTQIYVSKLRRLLGAGAILTEAPGYRLPCRARASWTPTDLRA